MNSNEESILSESQIKLNMYRHVYEDILKLREKYPYVRIEDLVEIYYAGMNRTWTEIRTEANTNTTVPSEEGNDATM